MKYLCTLSALAATTFAAVHQVAVGPGLIYSPDTITDAAEGDVIEFAFTGGHNVASGSFDSPCQPAGGVYSGEEPADGEIFSVTLNSTDPVWFYCAIPGHCQGGMVMVVNPSADQTLDSYKSAASSVSDSSAPSDVSGGVFGAVSDSSSSSSAADSSSSSSASASSSSAASASTSAAESSSSAAASSSSSRASAASTSASATSSSNGAAMTGVPMAAGMVVMGLAALL